MTMMYSNDKHKVYSPGVGAPSKKTRHHYGNILTIAHLQLHHICISVSAFEIQQYCTQMFVHSLLLIIFHHWHTHTHRLTSHFETETESSTTLIQKLAHGHDPQSVPSTSNPHIPPILDPP